MNKTIPLLNYSRGILTIKGTLVLLFAKLIGMLNF